MHGLRHSEDRCGGKHWAARRFGRFGEGPVGAGAAKAEAAGGATGSASAACWRKATSSCSRSL